MARLQSHLLISKQPFFHQPLPPPSSVLSVEFSPLFVPPVRPRSLPVPCRLSAPSLSISFPSQSAFTVCSVSAAPLMRTIRESVRLQGPEGALHRWRKRVECKINICENRRIEAHAIAIRLHRLDRQDW
eukprot:6183854-Pleurochrysis_carterae.AAC.1